MKKKIFKVGVCLFGILAVFCSVFLPISKNLHKVSQNQIAHADSISTNYQVDTGNLYFNQFFSTSNTVGAWADSSYARFGSLSISFRIVVVPGSVSFWIKYSGIVSDSNNFSNMTFGNVTGSGYENDPDYVDGFHRILTVSSSFDSYVQVPIPVFGFNYDVYFWIYFYVPTVDLDVFESLTISDQYGDGWAQSVFQWNCSNGNSCTLKFPSIYNTNVAVSKGYSYFVYSPRTYFYSTSISDNTIYSSGYDLGYSAGYVSGDTDGYSRGFTAGDTVGYSRGYTAGVDASNTYTFSSLIGAVIDVPVQTFTSLFHFEILGVYMDGFFLGLLTLCIIVFIVKLLI